MFTDAQNVLLKTRLSLQGAVLTVRPKRPDPRDQQENRRGDDSERRTGHPVWDQLTIEVTKFKRGTPKATFKTSFQDKTLCPCGGDVEEVDTSNQSSGIVYVKFKRPGGRCY